MVIKKDKDLAIMKTVLKDILTDYDSSFISVKTYNNDEIIIPTSECKIKITVSLYKSTKIQKIVTLEILKYRLQVKENTNYSRFSLYEEAEFSVDYFVEIEFSHHDKNIYRSLALYKGNINLGTVDSNSISKVNSYYVILNANAEIKRKVYF